VAGPSEDEDELQTDTRPLFLVANAITITVSAFRSIHNVDVAWPLVYVGLLYGLLFGHLPN